MVKIEYFLPFSERSRQARVGVSWEINFLKRTLFCVLVDILNKEMRKVTQRMTYEAE